MEALHITVSILLALVTLCFLIYQRLRSCLPQVEKVKVYAQQGCTAEALQEDALKRFNIALSAPFEVFPLNGTDKLLPKRYPRFTLLGQALGSIRVAWEALQLHVPEVFIDTTGWPFTYPLARLAGCRVACYVHYPTISADMLARVWDGDAGYKNDGSIAESPLKSLAKVIYYKAFALLYAFVGAFPQVVIVNSTWTAGHIRALWWGRHLHGGHRRPVRVYPPVDTAELQTLPLDRRLKRLYIVSVAQFRPEKNHLLQLQAYSLARQRAGNNMAGQAVRASRLKMIGSCRDADDEERLLALQARAEALGIGEHVDWCVNLSFAELKQMLGGAVGGLHSMIDEHFGISVVEYMAAGVIPIAYNSGGPKEDIVAAEDRPDGEPQTGFLASNGEEYAEAITKVLAMDQKDRMKIAAAAQKQAKNFSTEIFCAAFMDAIAPILLGM